MGEDSTAPQSGRRVTVDEAARHLGLSVDAVRKRVQRNQIAHERDAAGRVRIILDESETIQDEPQDTTRPDNTEELIATLREQLDLERQAHAEARRLLAAALERIPAIEAPQEPAESPATAESPGPTDTLTEAPTNPRDATERPQQRGRWSAPVAKLPWWHYVVGLCLVSLASFVSFFVGQMVFTLGLTVIGAVVATVVVAWSLPGLFGFWVGLRRRSPSLRLQTISFGLLVGLAVSLGRVAQLVAIGTDYFGGGSDMYYWSGFLVFPALPGWLFYVSGVLVGNARQRQRTGRVPGTVPASSEPTTGWTPRKQAYLGFAGTIIAALISLLSSSLSIIFSGG